MTGSLRMLFGACTNEWSPSDGRVVSVDHGCGAHSETEAERRMSEWPTPEPLVDTDAVSAFALDEPDIAADEADSSEDEPESPEVSEPTDGTDVPADTPEQAEASADVSAEERAAE